MFQKKSSAQMGRVNSLDFVKKSKNKITLILDNIRSMHNIGAAFRISDAFLIEEIFLCGICATPPRKEITKTALGADEHVAWRYFPTVQEAILEAKNKNSKIVAIEQVHNSIPLEKFEVDKNQSYALIFGHEVSGVDENILDLCDYSCEIMQYGVKHSLNVSVAMGIVCWKFTV